MIDTDKYEGHTEGPWHFCLGYVIKSDTYTGINPLKGGGDRVNGPVILSEYQFAKGTTGHRADMALITDAPLLLAEVKRHQLKDCAITQAEHMRAQVGDNTWHYAMEVWLYPETHYWDYDEEGTVQLIERYITTNRDAWVKHWGEPSEVARKRCEE